MKIKTYEDGSARLLWDWRDIALTTADFAALREYFQAERDETLGRWRDPEDPNMVVYPRPDQDDSYGRCMSLFDESSGEFWLAWERIATHDSSARYFAAHPESRPWENAGPGEIWELTGAGGLKQLWVRTELEEWRSIHSTRIVYYDAKHATAGRRVWPEQEEAK